MKRSIIVLAASALTLGGCSGGSKEQAPPAEKAAEKAPAKKGDEKPHVNPWAKDDPAAPSAPAPAVKKVDPKAKEEPKANPWAKEPPPGAQPAEAEKPAKK